MDDEWVLVRSAEDDARHQSMVKEADERMLLARQALKLAHTIRPWTAPVFTEFDAITFSTWMLVPLHVVRDFLQKVIEKKDPIDGLGLIERCIRVGQGGLFYCMRDLLFIFLEHGNSEAQKLPLDHRGGYHIPIAGEDMVPTRTEKLFVPLSRSLPEQKESEAYRARERDNHACIFLKTLDPQAVHIIPRWFGFSKYNQTLLNESLRNLDDLKFFPWKNGNYQSFSGDFEGDVDFLWNMISMNSLLQDEWEKLHFGLEVAGSLTPSPNNRARSRLRLRWHWLPIYDEAKDTDPLRWLDINGNLDDHLPAPPVISQKPTYGSNHWIKTGDIFEMDVDNKNLDKTLRAFELRWTLTQLAHMSGAVGSPELLCINFDVDKDEMLLPVYESDRERHSRIKRGRRKQVDPNWTRPVRGTKRRNTDNVKNRIPPL
ncbi:hypothetical protein B0T21DRAFT_454609 [Apiosordaria backusii]|uniref:HNH nuclease domain-containing protein n=1 Tax=Apiosordaria backusii TaxID=314023 RepID=A0AA40AEK3_9PEZI|nr:hypothetical protein B0T21DRAFT_454609 [Apiosordaria backusii]